MTADARTLSPPQSANDEKVLTILEHLQELRTRVMWCAGALVVGVGLSLYPLTGYAIDFLIEPGQDRVEGFKLHQFQLLEYWSTYFRVSLLLGIAIAMPMLMYQLFAFIGPGLTREERKWIYPIVFGCSLMFVAGMAFAYYVTLPPALGFLLDTGNENVEPTIGVRTYIDTVTRLLLLTGVTFQLPFVIMGLAKVGVVTSRKLWAWKRYAVVLAFIAGAIVTPSIDPITQTIVTVPILVLYGMGMILARIVEGNALIRPYR